MKQLQFSIGAREFRGARWMPNWYRNLIIKKEDDCYPVGICEYCGQKITSKEYDKGEYYHEIVKFWDEVDDEFWVHKRCCITDDESMM